MIFANGVGGISLLTVLTLLFDEIFDFSFDGYHVKPTFYYVNSA